MALSEVCKHIWLLPHYSVLYKNLVSSLRKMCLKSINVDRENKKLKEWDIKYSNTLVLVIREDSYGADCQIKYKKQNVSVMSGRQVKKLCDEGLSIA